MIHLIFSLAIALCFLQQAALSLELAPPFTDHMLLQRGEKIPVWGKAKRGVNLTIEFNGQRLKTQTNQQGNWKVSLDPMQASNEGKNLTVSDGSQIITCKNILVGDVWIATGQSNMGWKLRQSTGGKKDIAESHDPQLRLFNHMGSLHPGGKQYPLSFLKKMTVDNYYQTQGWQPCNPNSSPNFSGVAYYFGRALRRELNVPIGIVNFAVGGTPIEAHISPELFHKNPTLKPLLNNWWKNSDYPQWCRQRAAHNLKHWLADPELIQTAPPHPFAPHFLWDAGIARFLPLPVKGVIWYQGESNATVDGSRGKPVAGHINKTKFKCLVESWRTAWRKPKLPVYFVQLPGLNRPWPEFREMQLEASFEIPNCGVAVTIDVGHPTNVHPPNKKPVGERLARLALHGTYGQDIIPNGPILNKVERSRNKLTITFHHAKGLTTSDGKAVRGFELLGKNGKFLPAMAEIKNTTVVVTHPEIHRPLAVRYAWANNPDTNLINSEKIPASPFRFPKVIE